MIRFMVKHLSYVSCSPIADRTPPNGGKPVFPAFLITKCETQSRGGFGVPDTNAHPSTGGIVLCANTIQNKKQLEATMAHEMIHWWDTCRFQVNWDNLRHVACSEVCINVGEVP